MAEQSTQGTSQSAAPNPSRRPPRIFYGWWIVVVSLLADGLKHGSFNRGFTIYIPAIQADPSLGLSTAAIGFADTLGRFVGGLQGPLVGYLTDRFGPRVMLAFGGITVLAGLAVFSNPALGLQNIPVDRRAIRAITALQSANNAINWPRRNLHRRRRYWHS